MKKIIFLITLFCITIGNSQIYDPIKWATSVEKVSDTEYKLITKAAIEPGWHLYSQNVPDGGPIATTFTYDDANGAFKLKGNTTEEEGHTEYTELFGDGMDIKSFDISAKFEQLIEVVGDENTLTAFVEFQTCDDVKCLMPKEVELTFNLGGKDQKTSDAVAATTASDSNDDSGNSGSAPGKSKRGLFALFFIAFLSGFAALLTPCVFPMIPLTVSFFTKQSQNKAQGIRNAIFYGVSIVVIYVLLGVAVSAIFGPAAMNALASNVWFNLIFFLILIIFAVSFLGAFEITLPQSWANKVDAQSNRSGLVGIFFMALALAIVSFSCTGPIVGTILVEAASGGDKVGPIIGMLGFSLAIALPFGLFAAFPGWMNSLPKSGGWLNTVKVVLGFLELALAFKFLSTADLVLQLHIFEREIFLAIWIAVFGALAFYLFGKIQLPHDSPLTHISVGRLSLGLLVLAFTIYLIPGLWGAPLKLISGFPPPLNYSESPHGVGYTKLGSGGVSAHEGLPEDAHYGVHDIVMFHDYEKGLAYAKKVGKPALLDFTGWSCVNCRKMEEYVWSAPKVLELLKKEYVMISLYVDEKRKPYESEQGISEYLYPGKPFKKIGDKWAELQIMRYKSNAQPLYVLMDHNEENLLDPVAYTPDVDEYYTWLKGGVSKFKK
ncbi:protein-disulfide reductase DsbD family protein [Seonamhaeicola maritimus]|uniref:Thiol:disulfide interchange protein n=1 Tax=Seonamhaeicola maritimus TaxID=2591822 RepID=A0A5C7GFY8_9FLAO|nr:cytochrome c biogenesis protein CcdA [Seonamhaeicola maritimus]TXG35410.1 thiol:disulfide interchange protein [Seonamhaeicola maritimus]